MDKSRHYFSKQQGRLLGLGDADTTSTEFLSQVHRETYASLAQRQNVLQGVSLAIGCGPCETKQILLDEMVGYLDPVGESREVKAEGEEDKEEAKITSNE